MLAFDKDGMLKTSLLYSAQQVILYSTFCYPFNLRLNSWDGTQINTKCMSKIQDSRKLTDDNKKRKRKPRVVVICSHAMKESGHYIPKK